MNDYIQVKVPKSALVAAFLEKVARASELPESPLTEMQARAALLPSIGAPLENGIYAGITVHSNLPMALVLLPGESEEINWKAAFDWAKGQTGAPPSRMDALVLWQNLPKEFKEEWYWTEEEVAGYAAYAWVQSFDDGTQYGVHASNDYRCRAVRRVAI